MICVLVKYYRSFIAFLNPATCIVTPSFHPFSIFRQENNEDEEEEEKKKWKRPPSSYGSMKSDSDVMEEEEQEGVEEEAANAVTLPNPVVLPGSSAHEETG